MVMFCFLNLTRKKSSLYTEEEIKRDENVYCFFTRNRILSQHVLYVQ